MVTQSPNQFSQAPIPGRLDLQFPGNTASGQVASTVVTPLVAGQPVLVEDTVGGVPKFTALASQADTPNAFIVGNLKDQSFPALSRVEFSLSDSVMWMVAGGAIGRFKPVEVVFGTPGTVIAAAGVNPVVGFAYDKAVNVGDVIRVVIKVPAAGGVPSLRNLNVTATLAQINAGLIIIPGAAGKKITVTNFIERVVGAFASGTSVNLQSDTTSVIVEATAEAGLTNGAVLLPGTANVTLGAGFAAPLPVGEGLKIVNIGAAQTVGTSITFDIEYTQL